MPLWSRPPGETPKRSVSHALAFGATLLLVPAAAQANVLLNSRFETTVTAAGALSGFPVPAPPSIPDYEKTIGFAPWAVSAHNSLGGVGERACPGAFGFGRTGKGNWVATLNSALPGGVLPTPVAGYQTVDLQAGAYRFGGDFAMSLFAVAVGDNQTEAFLPIYAGGITFDSIGVPSIAGGSLPAAIDLSPARFGPSEFFIEGQDLSPVGKARQFQTVEDVFLFASDPLVTMQTVVLPKGTGPVTIPPYKDKGSAALIQATSLTLWADTPFIGSTRLQAVPAPGALAVFAVTQAGLAAVRRRAAEVLDSNRVRSWMAARATALRELRASLSKRVARRRKCLRRLKHRSMRLRWR